VNNVITASRMNCLLRCARQHFWQFEIGLRREETGLALRFGSAWARAMDARWRGQSYDEALAASIPEGVELDMYACATLSALLAAYYDYYGKREKIGKLHPEVQFSNPRMIYADFTVEGKIDGLGSLKIGTSVLLEAKTTSDSLKQDSDYWLRLRFNMQILHYVVEARVIGWDVRDLYYDVTKKPGIKPKTINDLDGDGLKIVLDAKGKRVFKKNKEPLQGGDKAKGYYIKSHRETPDEFCDRLYKDACARPEHYFARREVPVIDDELQSFERQRLALAKLTEHFRNNEDCDFITQPRDPEAWPRHVSKDTCNFCSYKSFCLQNISIDINQPPAGFAVRPFNPELQNEDDATTEETIDDATETSI
jgi:hypothetical protein